MQFSRELLHYVRDLVVFIFIFLLTVPLYSKTIDPPHSRYPIGNFTATSDSEVKSECSLTIPIRCFSQMRRVQTTLHCVIATIKRTSLSRHFYFHRVMRKTRRFLVLFPGGHLVYIPNII